MIYPDPGAFGHKNRVFHLGASSRTFALLDFAMFAYTGVIPQPAPLYPTTGQVSAFFDKVQDHFLSMLFFLAPFVSMNTTSLTASVDFGSGYTRRITVDANPVGLPTRGFGIMAAYPSARWVGHQMRSCIFDFLSVTKASFKVLSRDIQYCVATLTVSLALGDHLSSTVLQVRLGGVVNSPGDDDDDGDADIDVNENENQNGEEIEYLPIPPGFNYFDQFGQR